MRRRRTELITAGGLEVLALFLMQWQALGGVRTDEAKYLLNIPYPHPPFLRWILSSTEWIPFQEGLWRLIFATLLVQAVWLIWDMTRNFQMEDRIAVCAGWLLSAALLTQTGSIMLTTITALQALILLWLRTKHVFAQKYPIVIGLWWTTMLFTAYQGVLFLPIVWSVLRRAGVPARRTALYVLAPVGVLLLYSLSNPLALATMIIHKDEGVRDSLLTHIPGTLKLWILGGSGVMSAIGTWGIFRSRDLSLILSFILVAAFTFLSIPYPFYAILWTPLLVGGLFALFHRRRHPHAFPLLGCAVFACAILTWWARPSMTLSVARTVMSGAPKDGTVLIAGTFGHEWQYETTMNVRRYLRPEFANDAQMIVCLSACEPMFNTSDFARVQDALVEVWVRKSTSIP